MNNLRLVTGLIILFISVSVNAQKAIEIDTFFIKDCSDQLNLALYTKVKYADFKIKDELKDEALKYSPNRQINLGLYYHYQRFGFGLAFGIGFLNKDDDLKGKTSRIDLQGNIYGRRFVFDLSLMNYRSFYLRNTRHILTDWKKGDPNYIRSDIRMFNIGGSALYIFNNKKFSYRAAFLQTDIQKKSAGSFLGGYMLNINSLRGDSSFFPANSVFNTYPNTPLLNSFSAGVKFGYAYNYIFRKYYFASLAFSPTILFGIEYAFINGKDKTRLNLSMAFQPRFAIGYNSQLWYYGFSIVEDIFLLGDDMVKEGVSFRYAYGNVKFFIGRRFPSFDWDDYK